MKIPKKILKYAKENMNEVMHTTVNPEGPGVVRIHLIPPKMEDDVIESSVAIINGQDIIPVSFSWSILLSIFIKEVNKYSGQAIDENEVQTILEDTCREVRKVYTLLPKKRIKNDISVMMNTFVQIAKGETPDEQVDYINIGDYAPFMKAPHRMDLLVAAMTQNGAWHCNQNCIHCYAAGQELSEQNELTTDEWKKIIDKCREACIPQITFTGGEPTMREDLVELIEYSQWFVTRLNTNGIKLTKDYCEKLKVASLDSMQITFYSYDESVHNTLVGAKRYADTVEGIKNALEAGINISINTPLCTLNKDYVETLKFLHELGVVYVTCSGLICTGNATLEASENLRLSQNEITDILKSAADYCFENGMEISFTSPGWIDDEVFDEYGLNKPTCGACLSNMAVTPGGSVVPCQSYLEGETLGNMLTDEWDEIWNGEKCAEHRAYSARMTGLCPLREEAQ